MAKSIKREQEVVVIAGTHKGKRGKVLEVMGNDRILVEGVNMITKYERKTQGKPRRFINPKRSIDSLFKCNACRKI